MTEIQPLAPMPGELSGDYMNRLLSTTLKCATNPCDWGFTGIEEDAHALARTHCTMPGKTTHDIFFKSIACACGWEWDRMGGRVEIGIAVNLHIRTHIPEAQQ